MAALAIPLMVVMASSAGWVAGGAITGFGAARGAILAASIALLSGLSAAVRPRGTESATWSRVEFLSMVLIAIGAASAGGARTPARVAFALGLAVAIRVLVGATTADLAMMDRVADDRPVGAPPDRIRLRVLGFGVLLTTIAAYASANNAGFADLGRRAVGGQFWAVAIWFGCGIVGVGVVSLHARQAAWDRNGVKVDRDVGQRWVVGVVSTALVVLGVILATPIVSGQLTAVPAQAINQTDGLDRFVTNMLELLSRDGGSAEAQDRTDDQELRDAIGSNLERDLPDRPAWVGEVMLTAIIATIFVWAVRLGRGARVTRTQSNVSMGVWAMVRALASDFGAGLSKLVVGLLAWFRSLGRHRSHAADRHMNSAPADSAWRRSRWTPRGIPERRVARAFAALVRPEKAQPGETPTEVAQRIGRRTDPAASGVVLSAYLDARYSAVEILGGRADDVEIALERVERMQEDHRELE